MMPSDDTILLSTAYLGPVQYFSKIIHYKNVTIEQHEHFIKQTYRNRCIILGANGPVTLVIPVVGGRSQKIPIKDLKIAYDEDWQRNHWRTIFSAYNSSPFFEYYTDDLIKFYSKRFSFLLDYTIQITATILELLELDIPIKKSDSFIKEPENTIDFRTIIHPKKQNIDFHFNATPYTQVFSEKFKFIPNLSILDLLFNKGPESSALLEDCFINVDYSEFSD